MSKDLEKYLRIDDLNTLTEFERLVVKAKLNAKIWIPYRMDFILCEGKPVEKSHLRSLIEEYRKKSV